MQEVLNIPYDSNTILTWGEYKFTALCRIPAKWLIDVGSKSHDKKLISWIARNYLGLLDRSEREESGIDTREDVCTKYRYASEQEAKKHLKEIKAKGKLRTSHVLPVRAYKCNICPFYHLTSKELINQ